MLQQPLVPEPAQQPDQRCQNLAGAVEVVLGSGSFVRTAAPAGQLGSDADPSQLTGCTSPRTTITFNLADASIHPKPGNPWTDVYVLDAWGAVLARADLPKLPH